ncbi:sulfotransferase family protein [Nitzschia inconspicua]|uniref:Sulfotransferase family protein n=1 Tax=Nitzschia inconspicua TaxID=303405 RepID=A0A9K3L6H4_9STRA|nr:sulfotransferase family protein [Nitzschia inconspicua]
MTTMSNLRVESASPSQGSRTKRFVKQVAVTKLIIGTILIGLLIIFLLVGDASHARNLRLNAILDNTIITLKLQEKNISLEYEDSYHPYDTVNDPLPHCDSLPLQGGHNVWSEDTGETIRLHKHSTRICGPKVLVIGAMKCGTNTLGHLLAKHPRVKVNSCSAPRFVKEIDTGCNDDEYQGRGDEIWEGHDMSIHKNQKPGEWLEHWTRRLPWTDGKHNITIDKSPSYMNTLEFPNLTQDVKQFLPNAKVVMSVCNPALRLYSEYNHNMDQRQDGFLGFYRDKGIEVPMDFPSFVKLLMDPPFDVCKRLPNFCDRNQIFFLRKGEYSTLLKQWYEAFGPKNILVVDMNDNQRDIATKLLDLVGHDVLPPKEYPWHELKEKEIDFQSSAANYTGRSSAFDDFREQIAKLEKYYAPFNQELAQLIGRDFPLKWNERMGEN